MRVVITLDLDAPTIAAIRNCDAAAGKRVRRQMFVALLAQLGVADVTHRLTVLQRIEQTPPHAQHTAALLVGAIATAERSEEEEAARHSFMESPAFK